MTGAERSHAIAEAKATAARFDEAAVHLDTPAYLSVSFSPDTVRASNAVQAEAFRKCAVLWREREQELRGGL